MLKDRSECVCNVCNKSFTTDYALSRHKATNDKCLIIRLKDQLNLSN